VIIAVEILAAAQLAVISMLAVTLTWRRIAHSRRDRRRALLLDHYRNAVLEFVGMDDDDPPEQLLALRTAEQREAVGELLTQYTGTVRGDARRRVSGFASHQGYAAAAAGDLSGRRRAWRRGTAAKTLGDFGVRECGDELAGALASDHRQDVRVAAARALGRVGGGFAAGELLASCGDRVPTGVASQALLDVGSEAMPWLLGALHAEREPVRQVACRVIGLVGAGGDDSVVSALGIACTNDASVDVRVAACEALGRVGGRDAALAVAGATCDSAAEVRRAACEAATRLAAPEMVPAVERALDDQAPEVRRAAARAAVLLGVDAGRAGDFMAEAEADLAWGWS
jgi:hypothetical protein